LFAFALPMIISSFGLPLLAVCKYINKYIKFSRLLEKNRKKLSAKLSMGAPDISEKGEFEVTVSSSPPLISPLLIEVGGKRMQAANERGA